MLQDPAGMNTGWNGTRTTCPRRDGYKLYCVRFAGDIFLSPLRNTSMQAMGQSLVENSGGWANRDAVISMVFVPLGPLVGQLRGHYVERH